MASGDGSVEIKITGSVDASVAASATEAKASMTGLRDGFDQSAATMVKATQLAGGNLKKITPDIMAQAAAMTGNAAAATADAVATDADTVAKVANTVATEANTGAVVSSKAVYEGLALIHEGLAGRYTRMASTSMIFGQALAGNAATASLVGAAMTPLGAAILAVGIAAVGTGGYMAYLTYQEYEATKAANAAAEAFALTGRGSLNTAEAIQGEAAELEAMQGVTRKAAEELLAFDASHAEVNDRIREAANQLLPQFIEAYGKKGPEAVNKLKLAMSDIENSSLEQAIEKFNKLNETTLGLHGPMLQHIQDMIKSGDASAAMGQALADLAANGGAHIASLNDQVRAAQAELVTAKEKAADLTAEVSATVDPQAIVVIATAAAQATGQVNILIARLKQLQGEAATAAHGFAAAAAAAAIASTPEGKDTTELDTLIGKRAILAKQIVDDTAEYGKHSAAVTRDKQAYDDYDRAVTSFKGTAEKAHALAVLDDKLAVARHAHNQADIADLTRKKELLSQSGDVRSQADANQKADDAAKTAGDRGAGRGAKGPDIVSTWTEQLHAAEVASGEFFADQTAKELEFWQSKVGATKAGSKDWLAVQSKIYEASKTLAKQSYEEHLGTLNDQLEADKDNWSKEKSVWDDKLTFIKAHYGAESTEYKNAFKEFEAAERQHEQQMVQAQRAGEKTAIDILKSNLATQLSIRQADAKETEALLKEQGAGSPFGEVDAAIKSAAINRQVNQQKLADDAETYAQEDVLRRQAVERELLAYAAVGAADKASVAARLATDQQYRATVEASALAESNAYIQAVHAKELADTQFHNQQKLAEDQWKNQSIQDILAVQQAYHSYIDGVIGATSSGLVGVIGKTQTWAQALSGIYNSVLSSFSTMLTKMVSNWVVEHVFMTAAQRAQLAIQRAQFAVAQVSQTATVVTNQAAQTAATTAGVAARTSVEHAGFFTKIIGFLASLLGIHIGNEASKTAATTAAATARSTAEITATESAAIAQRLTVLAQIPVLAGLAGAGGVASMAAAPFPIDLTAPAFGAAMAVSSAAFGAGAGLAQGTNYVPNDMVTQIHEGERVIPKADNRALMDALNDNANPFDRRSRKAAGGDTIHNHYYQISAMDGASVERVFNDNKGPLAVAIKAAHREGRFK